mmetsp:Transcript_28684/g.82412  ORF Transcript_28684/g.82412 Transcript_28684/m.82412 type:complete len:363 (+) Transcript_28684:272-1360(+)
MCGSRGLLRHRAAEDHGRPGRDVGLGAASEHRVALGVRLSDPVEVGTGLRRRLLQLLREAPAKRALGIVVLPAHGRVVVDKPGDGREVETGAQREAVGHQILQFAIVVLGNGRRHPPQVDLLILNLGGGLGSGLEEVFDRREDVLVSHQEVAQADDQSVALEPLVRQAGRFLDTDLVQQLFELQGLSNASGPHRDAVLLHNDLGRSREQGPSPEVNEQVLRLNRGMVPLRVLVQPRDRVFHLDDVRARSPRCEILHDLLHRRHPLDNVLIFLLHGAHPLGAIRLPVANAAFGDEPTRHAAQGLLQGIACQAADDDKLGRWVLGQHLQVPQQHGRQLRVDLGDEPRLVRHERACEAEDDDAAA